MHQPVLDRGRALWQLARPRTCLVGVFSYGTAVGLVGTPWTLRTTAWAVTAFMISAVANLHNSYTDLAEDARNLPGRLDLVRRVGVGNLQVIVYSILAVIAVISAWVHVATLALAAIGTFLLISYSAPPLRAKARPVLGLIIFAMVVEFPFLAGMLSSPQWSVLSNFERTTAPWFAAFVFALFISKGMIKNVPDYRGDRDSGLRTSATVWPTIERAGQVAAASAIIVYGFYPVVVFTSGAPLRMLLPAVWLVPVAVNALRFTRGGPPAALNRALKWDMSISAGFLASTMLCAAVTVGSLITCAVGAGILWLTDRIGADSRADVHLAGVPAKVGEVR